MANYKKIFMSYLDQEGIRYADHAEFAVRIPYSGENLKSIPLFVSFDREGRPFANIKCFEIANFKGKEAIGIQTCNELNKQYRWAKFFMDEDADIIVSVDTYVDENTCGFFCLELVKRSVAIIDETYPRIASALWA